MLSIEYTIFGFIFCYVKVKLFTGGSDPPVPYLVNFPLMGELSRQTVNPQDFGSCLEITVMAPLSSTFCNSISEITYPKFSGAANCKC